MFYTQVSIILNHLIWSKFNLADSHVLLKELKTANIGQPQQ